MSKQGWAIGGAVALLLATGGYYASAQTGITLHAAHSAGNTGHATRTVSLPNGGSVSISTTTTQPATAQGYALNDWSTGGNAPATNAPKRMPGLGSGSSPVQSSPPMHSQTPTAKQAATPTSPSVSASHPTARQAVRWQWSHDHPDVQPAFWGNIGFTENTQWVLHRVRPGIIRGGSPNQPRGIILSEGLYGQHVRLTPNKVRSIATAALEDARGVGGTGPIYGFHVVQESGQYPGGDGKTVEWQGTSGQQAARGWAHETHTGEIMTVTYYGVHWPQWVEVPDW